MEKHLKKNNLYQIYLKVEIVLLSQKKIHYNTEQNARILREMGKHLKKNNLHQIYLEMELLQLSLILSILRVKWLIPEKNT